MMTIEGERRSLRLQSIHPKKSCGKGEKEKLSSFYFDFQSVKFVIYERVGGGCGEVSGYELW